MTEENQTFRNKENNPVRPVYGVIEFSTNVKTPVTRNRYHPDIETEGKRTLKRRYVCISSTHLRKDFPKKRNG